MYMSCEENGEILLWSLIYTVYELIIASISIEDVNRKSFYFLDIDYYHLR